MHVAHCAFEIALSGAIMLTLLLVCSFSPKVQKYLLGPPEYRISDRLRSTICCKQQCYACVRQIAQSLAMSAALDFRKCKRLLLSSLAVSPKGFTPQVARHRRAEPPKRKEPDKIGFVFFICGGDEGGRTPYLLNAIQALYQLSYTPKADNKRKYTIFTSFCQLHLNKWVKCFGTNFFVYLIHSRFARARAART